MRSNRGFSLVEILVVMAISVILVGLVLAPVIQAFKMTRQAQAMIDAQDAARIGMEQISRELGEAMFVFDNSVAPATIYDDGATPTSTWTYANGQQGPIQLPVRQVDNSIECFTLPHGKIDFILPKMTMHCDNPGHPSTGPRDYPRGNEAWPPCPVCTAAGLVADNVSARPKIPLEQDVTIVRYFLGLRYNSPKFLPGGTTPPPGQGVFGWRSPWVGQVQLGDENQVVLYRVEFDPHDKSLFPPKPESMTDSEWMNAKLSDPLFFYRSVDNEEPDPRPCCDRWMEIARVVGIGKYQDLVVGTFNANPGDCTAVEPSITFKFQAINNDTFAGAYSEDRGFEYPNAVPAVYLASYGYWIDNHTDWAGQTPAQLNDESNYNYAMTIYRDDNALTYYTRLDATGHLIVCKSEYSGVAWSDPAKTFDITEYLNTGQISGDAEMGFTVDLNHGRIDFALTPPGLPCRLSPAAINAQFHDTYDTDPGSARRMWTLIHFAPGPAATPNPQWLKFARIVPGSDRVGGPDMTPGAGYGQKMIRYERVPLALGDPGLNQYKIDYDTGVIYFSSMFNQDLPEMPDPSESDGVRKIQAFYKVQYNRDGDIVKGNYTTRSLITVHVGIRMFDPETASPHEVDLTNSIKVRNAHR